MEFYRNTTQINIERTMTALMMGQHGLDWLVLDWWMLTYMNEGRPCAMPHTNHDAQILFIKTKPKNTVFF